MSENHSPALTRTVHEVQGHFPDDATLQIAQAQLGLAGYDRADFSLPQDRAEQTPNGGAENPVDQTDKAQLRTMGTSMAGYAGAIVAAGATLATGGAAGVALAAAAAVGAGSALTANAAGHAADTANKDDHDERGREGRLVLAVRVMDGAGAEAASAIMRKAGAARIETVSRGADMLTAGVSAASWTGD